MSDHEIHIGHGDEPDPTIMGNSVPRLRALSDLKHFRIADDDPDIRDWIVRDANGDTIGRVHDVIAEMDTRQVRYLDVAINLESETRGGREHHCLVPIGLARLNDDSNIVSVGSLTRERLLALRPYDHKAFTRDDELELLGQLQGLAGPAADTPDLYQHAVFALAGFWGARREPESVTRYGIVTINRDDEPDDRRP